MTKPPHRGRAGKTPYPQPTPHWLLKCPQHEGRCPRPRGGDALLKQTARCPRSGDGGIYLELDTRDVPDVAKVVADDTEGCQRLISWTICNDNSRIKQVIRGHHGSFEFGNGEHFTEFRFVAKRPQGTRDSSVRDEVIQTGLTAEDLARNTASYLHFLNWIEAIRTGMPVTPGA